MSKKNVPLDLDTDTVQLIRQMLHRGPSGADDVTKQRYHDVIDTFCDQVADLLRMIELASEEDEDED